VQVGNTTNVMVGVEIDQKYRLFKDETAQID